MKHYITWWVRVNLELIKWLVKQGLDVNSKNSREETPFLFAVENFVIDGIGNRQIVQWLLEHGADVNAKDDEKKKEFFRKMEKVAKEQRARVVNADAFDYYESAVNSIVRELAPLMPGALPKDVAQKIKHDFTAQEIRVALKLLVKLDFLKVKGENVYEQTDKVITGSGEALKLALRSMNGQMIDLAREAIEKIAPGERNISGVTIGVDETAVKRISEEVNRFRKQVIAIAGESKTINQVYRLNLQLFPLSEKV